MKQKAIHILDCQLRDTVKSHILNENGVYEKVDRRGKEAFCAQDYFVKEAAKDQKTEKKGKERVFKKEVRIDDI